MSFDDLRICLKYVLTIIMFILVVVHLVVSFLESNEADAVVRMSALELLDCH